MPPPSPRTSRRPQSQPPTRLNRTETKPTLPPPDATSKTSLKCHFYGTDPIAPYPASEIAEVYLRRWRIELSFRDIKTTMEMEHLRAQRPQIATKELLAALIAYNLVRITMIEASRRHGTDLERLSFKGTVDGLRQYCPRMARARSLTALRRLERG